MSIYDFARIESSKAFEKLTLDLLEAEGFQTSYEPSPISEGINIIEEEIVISHSGFSHTLRWFVSCRHSNGKFLSTREVRQIFNDFEQSTDDGLLIVVDTGITEENLLELEDYINRNEQAENSKITLSTQANRKHLIHLRQILESRFSNDELRTFCYDLGVDYDGLPGEGKFNKARELVSYLERRDQISNLVEIGEKLRPDVSWEQKSVQQPDIKQNNQKRKMLIQIWDQRQLENRLLRHPRIAQKYQLSKDADSALPFNLSEIKDKSILVISDTSPFSYQLFSSLNKVNSNVQLITMWQYSDPIRCQLLLKEILDASHDLVIFFLGDTFGVPIPDVILEKLVKTEAAGRSIIFFPFFAWALHQGAYQILDKLVPVKLADEPHLDQLWLKASRIFATNDVSWLNAEAFIENQSVTIKVDNRHPVLHDIKDDFDIIHSFEFLNLKEDATCILTDNVGTPFLVVNEATKARVVYINSCTHNCLTKTPVLSPFETSEQFRQMIVNTVLWCLDLEP